MKTSPNLLYLNIQLSHMQPVHFPECLHKNKINLVTWESCGKITVTANLFLFRNIYTPHWTGSTRY